MSATIIPREQAFLSGLLVEENYTPLNALADAMPQLVWIAKPDGKVIYYSNRVSDFAGAKKEGNGAWSWQGLLHPEDQEPTAKAWTNAVLSSGVYEKERWVVPLAFKPCFSTEK
jgi:PAS domain-containing protein